MSSDADERAPLLQFPGAFSEEPLKEDLSNAYEQFCRLIGNRPVDLPLHHSFTSPEDSLYHRAIHHRRMQGYMYTFTSTFINTLLLSQVVLGAALTGLGASNSSHVLITVFGALNTVIAGLVTFLKSRGQPMRARMFRDDLDRVVDEIDNSAIMWKGISQKVHGYDAIDTDEAVTVRSEVARLTRLYDRAVRTNTMNDPDFYGPGGLPSDPKNAGLRSRTGQPLLAAMPANIPGPATAPITNPVVAPEPVAGPSVDPDESPATKASTQQPPKLVSEDGKSSSETTKDAAKTGDKGKQPEVPKPEEHPLLVDADDSPATDPHPAKAEEKPKDADSKNQADGGQAASS